MHKDVKLIREPSLCLQSLLLLPCQLENVVICWFLLTCSLHHVFSPLILGLFLYLFSLAFHSYFPLPPLLVMIPKTRMSRERKDWQLAEYHFLNTEPGPPHAASQFLFVDFFIIFTISTCKKGSFTPFPNLLLYFVIWNKTKQNTCTGLKIKPLTIKEGIR